MMAIEALRRSRTQVRMQTPTTIYIIMTIRHSDGPQHQQQSHQPDHYYHYPHYNSFRAIYH